MILLYVFIHLYIDIFSPNKCTPENLDGTQQSPNWKGKTSSKLPFLGCMLLFQGVLESYESYRYKPWTGLVSCTKKQVLGFEVMASGVSHWSLFVFKALVPLVILFFLRIIWVFLASKYWIHCKEAISYPFHAEDVKLQKWNAFQCGLPLVES